MGFPPYEEIPNSEIRSEDPSTRSVISWTIPSYFKMPNNCGTVSGYSACNGTVRITGMEVGGECWEKSRSNMLDASYKGLFHPDADDLAQIGINLSTIGPSLWGESLINSGFSVMGREFVRYDLETMAPLVSVHFNYRVRRINNDCALSPLVTLRLLVKEFSYKDDDCTVFLLAQDSWRISFRTSIEGGEGLETLSNPLLSLFGFLSEAHNILGAAAGSGDSYQNSGPYLAYKSLVGKIPDLRGLVVK